MPTYVVTGPDGKKYRVDAPKGATEQQAIAYIANTQYENGQSKGAIEDYLEEIPLVGDFLSGTADVGLGLVQGAAGVTGAAAEAFGANNAVSGFFEDIAEGARGLMSAEERGDLAEGQRIMKEAEDKGILDQTLAALRAFSKSPLTLTAQGLGSAAPFAVAGALSGGTAVPVGLGALVGAGAVKGSIYDSVAAEARAKGMSAEQAAALADEAQGYLGENVDQIALGTVIGGVAGRFGLEPAVARAFGKEVAERAILRTAASEAATEAGQAGQERFAGNLAAQRAGFDVPLGRGVAGQAALEGIMGGVPGALAGAMGPRAAVEEGEIPPEIRAAYDRLPAMATDEDKVDAISNLMARGMPEETARTVVERMAAQKVAEEEYRRKVAEEREALRAQRTADVDEDIVFAEPDITAPGMVPEEGGPTPPPIDLEEQAAREQFYAEQMGAAPVAPPTVEPAPTGRRAFEPTEVTPQRAANILNNPVALSDFMARFGMDEAEAVETLSAIEAGEPTTLKYSRGRRPIDTQTEDMFAGAPLQEAPGIEAKREELAAQRFATDEERAARQEQFAAEMEAGQERVLAMRQREEEQREETLGDIEYALRAQAPENAVYKVEYNPEDANPYKLVAETRLGKKPEEVLSAKTLQDFSDMVYGQMMELTPYIPEAPAAIQEIEERETGEQVAPTAATRMVQEFTAEVDAAREQGLIDNNQRAQLLGRLQRPNAYRTLPNGRQVPNDAIAKLEKEAIDAASAAANAPAEQKEATAAASKEANDRLRTAVKNSLLNPARAALRSMVENRQLEREGAGIRAKEAEAEGDTREARDARIDLKEAQVQKYRRGPDKGSYASSTVEDVQRVVDAVTSQWKSDVPVEVVQSVDDIQDGAIRRAIKRDNAEGAEGFVAPNGVVYLIADNLPSAERARAVLFHEGLGHIGLESVFREELDGALDALYKGNAKLRGETDQWLAENPDAYINDKNRTARAVEEVLAERSENGQLRPSLIKRIASIIRNYARKLGLKLAISDADVEAILAAAHERVVTGDKVSAFVKGMRYIREDRVRATPLASKTFLRELGVFSNAELMNMSYEDAVLAASRLGIDQEWVDYFNSRQLAARTPEGSEAIKLPQPDMSKYMPKVPKYSKPKTSQETKDELADMDASMSTGLRRATKTQDTYAMADGLGAAIKARKMKPFIKAFKENVASFTPPSFRTLLGSLPTSGIIDWYGKEIPSLEDIDDLVLRMSNMKANIIKAAEPTAQLLNEFLLRDKDKVLAKAQGMSRINSYSPDTHASMDAALQNDKVMQEIEKFILKNSNDKKLAKQLIEEVKALTVRGKEAKRVKPGSDTTVDSAELIALANKLRKTAVDSTKVDDQLAQLTEWTRRIRDGHKVWDELGKIEGGHQLYKEMRAFYKDMFEAELALLDARIDTLTDEKQAKRLRDMRADMMREALSPEEAQKAGDIFYNIDADLFSKDYFPFMREGKYYLRVKESKKAGRESEFYTFYTAKERDRALERVAQRLGADKDNNDVFAIGDDIADLQEDLKSEDMLMQRIFSITDKARRETAVKGSLGGKEVQELVDDIYQTWLFTTPERSVRRRMMHAEEVTGYSQDLLNHFSRQVTSYANQLSKMAFAGQIRMQVDAAKDSIKDRPATKQARLQDVIREMEDRSEQEINPDPQSDLVNMLNRAAYIYYLTAPATAVIQTTSIPIRVVPRLWKDYGYAKGTAMWMKYMKVWNTLGVPSTEVIKTGIGDQLHAKLPSVLGSKLINNDTERGRLLQRAARAGMERNVLETVTDTLLQNERETAQKFREGAARTATEAAAQTAKVMGVMFQGMENMTRQVSYFMTFELAYDDYKAKNPNATEEQAFDHAVRQGLEVVRDALGEYSNWERPRIAKGNWTRALFLFKMHAIVQTKFLVQSIKALAKGTAIGAKGLAGGRKMTAEERAEYVGTLKELSGVLMMSGMFGGLMGLPLYSVMAWALAESFDDEDDEDVRKLMGLDAAVAYDSDIMFRKWLQDKFGTPEANDIDLADILINGPIAALTNTELASRTSLDLKNMWFREGMGGDNTANSVLNALAANVAGASMAVSLMRGYDDFVEGNIESGLKKIAPAFFRSWVTTADQASRGVVDNKGNTIIPKSDIEAYDSARSLLGFRPMDLARWQDYYITRAKNDKRIDAEKTAIMRKLDKQLREGDIATQQDFIDFWNEEIEPFNRAYPNADYVITMESIERSLKGREEVRARTYQGMQLDKKTAAQDYEMAKGFDLQ